MILKTALISILGIFLLALGTFAQDSATTPGFSAVQAELLETSQQFVVTFHRPVLNNEGKPDWIPETETVRAGAALSEEEIAKGFKTGDRVVIRIKAPVDSYVYVVNDSDWDGRALVTNGTLLKANRSRDLVYRLTNNQNNKSVGIERLSFMITKAPANQTIIGQYFTSTGLPTTKTTPPIIAEAPKEKSGKTKSVAKIACGIVSWIFPWAKPVCAVTGFTAVEFEDLPNNSTGIKLEKDGDNLAGQFRFPVLP